MPFSQKKIIQMVKEGVKEELNTKIKGTTITPAQGAKAAVDAKQELKELRRQIRELHKYVEQHLPPSPTGTGSNGGTGRTSGSRTGRTSGSGTSGSGTGPASNDGTGRTSGSGTGGRRTGTGTRTSPTT